MITKEEKEQYLKQLLTGAVRYLIEKEQLKSDEDVTSILLNELDARGIDKQMVKQRTTNFKNYKKHVNDLVVKGISPEFIDFSNGIAKFKIPSSNQHTGDGPKEYELAVRFYEWDKFFDDPMLPMFRRIDRLLKGNVGIACGCESFKYHFGYQTYLKGSDIYDQQHSQLSITTPALLTNPKNIGIGCKHLIRLMNPYNYRLYVGPMVMQAIAEKLPNNGKNQAKTSPSAPTSKQKVYPNYKLPRDMKPQ